MRSWGALVVVAACAVKPAVREVAPSSAVVDEALPAQQRFAPPGPAADAYADLVAIAPRDALDEHLIATLQSFSVAERPMHLDAALSAACAELASARPDERGFSAGLVEFALARHGVVEPSPKIAVIAGDPTRPAELASLLRAQLADRDFHAAALRIGIGVGPIRAGRASVVVAVLGTRISIVPIRRASRTGERVTLDAKLDARLRDPQLAVVRDDGTVARTPLVGPTAIACGVAPGELRVEITARHPTGPATVASFPLWCGTTPPQAYRWEHAAVADGVATRAELERRLVALVNRDRRAAGVAPLALDPEAAAAARAHVLDGRAPVLHGSAYSVVAAPDLRAAYEALANGTAGREHLLADSSTRIGVAVAARDGELRATLIYRRVPPTIDVDAATREVTNRITAWTGVEAYPPLVQIAQRFADELVAGTPQPEAWQDMRWWLQDIRVRFAHFNYGIAFVPKVSLTTRDAVLGPGTVDAFGVAVRQADHPRYGPRTIWIVVMYGERK